MWTVWIALLLWAAPTQGVSTNCEIPAVEKLQNTSLTCKFSEDISKQKQDFEVHFYKNNTTDSSETILHCYWMDNKLECRVHNCCEYDRHVNETLTLRILSVTDTRVGRYVCFVLPAAPDGNNFCNFTLREKIIDTSGGNLAVLSVLFVIPVIICVLIVWRMKCSKKAEDKTTRKKRIWIDTREQFQINETEDDAYEVDHAKETDPCLDTNNSNVLLNPATRSQGKPHTIIQMSELASLQDTSEAPTRTQDQTLQAVDKVGTLVKIKTNEDDDGTRTTRETSQTLRENELQTENETKDKKTQESDEYKYTNDITKEERKAKRLRKRAMKIEKGAKEKARKYEMKAKDKAEKEIKSAKEKAKQEKATAKGKAEELEKIAKDKAEREERMVNDKAKEEEQIAKDNAEREEGTAKKFGNTAKNIEEQVKKISNEKEEQMIKIAKRKEQQMEIIAKEKEEKLEKIAKEKREELEKIANAKEKQLQEISKRKAVEIEKIRKNKEEEIEKIRKVIELRMERIIYNNEENIEEIKKKEEKQSKEKVRGENHRAVREPYDDNGYDEQLQIHETEDDAYEVDHAKETDPCLDTNNSNVQVNPATKSQGKPHTIIQMSELVSHQHTSEAPTRTQDLTLQEVDKLGIPVKIKTNEDKESKRNASTQTQCMAS